MQTIGGVHAGAMGAWGLQPKGTGSASQRMCVVVAIVCVWKGGSRGPQGTHHTLSHHTLYGGAWFDSCVHHVGGGGGGGVHARWGHARFLRWQGASLPWLGLACCPAASYRPWLVVQPAGLLAQPRSPRLKLPDTPYEPGTQQHAQPAPCSPPGPEAGPGPAGGLGTCTPLAEAATAVVAGM